MAAAAAAAVDDDPSLSKLLAVTSASFGELTTESVAALHQAWAADPVVNRLPAAPCPLNGEFVSIDPSGTRAVVGAGSQFINLTSSWNYLEVVDPRPEKVQWTFEPPQKSASPFRPFFTPDGTEVVTGVIWVQKEWEAPDPPPDSVGAFFLDAESGEIVDHIDLGRCGGIVDGMSDTQLLIKRLRGASAQTCDWQSGPVAVELSTEGPAGARYSRPMVRRCGSARRSSADGRFVAFDDFDTGARERDRRRQRRDGAQLRIQGWARAGDQPGRIAARLRRTDRDLGRQSGEVAPTYTGHDGTSYYVTFDASGSGRLLRGRGQQTASLGRATGSADLRAPRDRPAAHLGDSRRPRRRRWSMGRPPSSTRGSAARSARSRRVQGRY